MGVGDRGVLREGYSRRREELRVSRCAVGLATSYSIFRANFSQDRHEGLGKSFWQRSLSEPSHPGPLILHGIRGFLFQLHVQVQVGSESSIFKMEIGDITNLWMRNHPNETSAIAKTT